MSLEIVSLESRVTATYLAFRNRQHAALRERLGKRGTIVDTSLEKSGDGKTRHARNDRSFNDLTDSQNEDFIFVL